MVLRSLKRAPVVLAAELVAVPAGLAVVPAVLVELAAVPVELAAVPAVELVGRTTARDPETENKVQVPRDQRRLARDGDRDRHRV